MSESALLLNVAKRPQVTCLIFHECDLECDHGNRYGEYVVLGNSERIFSISGLLLVSLREYSQSLGSYWPPREDPGARNEHLRKTIWNAHRCRPGRTPE